MSLHLQRQIERLKKLILALGAKVEETVEDAIRAVEHRDTDLAATIIASDVEIDFMEIDVEEECLHTLALHQPVAFDLRFVVAVLKINNDLERIGDLAVNIAERVAPLSRAPAAVVGRFDLPALTIQVRTMLKQAMDALVNIDPTLAQAVREQDDQVDARHRQMYTLVQQAVLEDPANTPHLIQVLSVSRNLERIADHAVNIAEDVIYMAKGDILRHSKPINPGLKRM